MKKKLSALLAFVLAFCMSIPVFAAPSKYPTNGDPANTETTFVIEKNYVKLDGTTQMDKFPAETLRFESTCIAAPVEKTTAPNLTVAPLEVTGVKQDITVTVPTYTVPGKYEYSNAIVHAFQKFKAPFSGKIVHIFPEQSAVI